MNLSYRNTPGSSTIEVPLSKSICNRLLILQSLFPSFISLVECSDSDDSQVLANALNNPTGQLYVGAAGTAMRFLTARACLGENQIIEISGTERMHERPIGILVDALKLLGANIQYLGKVGFPPLKIISTTIEGGEIQLNPSVSSQFVSALMLVAPAMKKGLRIQFTQAPVSLPYITMTGQLLEQVGLTYHWSENEVVVYPGTPRRVSVEVERDWSGVAPWIMFCALEKKELFFPGFSERSIQGDSRIVQLVEAYGVKCHFENGGLRVIGGGVTAGRIFMNLNDQPDLAQVLIVTAALMNIPGRFTGLSTLQIKETNRLVALQEVLANLNVDLHIDHESAEIESSEIRAPKGPFKTYDDHRMAFVLLLVATRFEIELDHPEVVSKSYPKFWEEAKKLGFLLTK